MLTYHIIFFDCKTEDKKAPCSYTQNKPNEIKRILCEKDQSKNKMLPVHLDDGRRRLSS